MALSVELHRQIFSPYQQNNHLEFSQGPRASGQGHPVFQARRFRQASAKRQVQNLRKGILRREVGLSQLPAFAPSFGHVRGKSRWSMKAVSAPPAKSKEYLPPPEDTATGWEAGLIGVERKINHALTDFVVILLDAFYADRHYARFYVLETIARVPYFSYVSVLHMYESFGWWRRADYIKVHFAESWNELHHLLIMESLGGDRRWIDRFLAQHVAVVYYVLCCLIYLVSPRMAYHLMECVETHAYHTYDSFLATFGDKLKTKPAPEVAVKYYTDGDLYMFDEFQTAATPGVRRPKIENLYDVFVNVRDDEGEHCKTMRACQTAGSISSPHQDTPVLPGDLCSGVVECSTTAVSAADRYLKHGVPIDDTL